MDDADHAWLVEALAHWKVAEQLLLRLDPEPLPQVIAIDAECTFTLPSGEVGRMRSTAHGGTVQLPDGGSAPDGPIAFAGFRKEPFFAMSLPSVWREAGVTSVVGLERFLHGVLMHEIAHTRHAEMAHRLVEKLAIDAGFADDADLSDDIVQIRFERDPDYVAAWQMERDLFFAAAVVRDDAEARRLAHRAFAMMQARHDRWFVGKDAVYRDFDGIFLTMEGMGQWLIYRFFQSEAGGSLSPRDALPAVRRGGEQWSQDQGLAVMLVVDRFLPGWQERAFSDPDFRAERLLQAALES